MLQLPDDEADKAYDKETGERLHSPEWVAQPVPLLTLAEHDLPADHDDDQQRQADRVELKRLLPQLNALSDQIIRVAKRGPTCGERQETDRHVDQEDPPPRTGIRDPAPQGRTDGGRNQRREAE